MVYLITMLLIVCVVSNYNVFSCLCPVPMVYVITMFLAVCLQRKAVQDEKLKFLKEHFMNITPFKEKQSPSQLHQKGQIGLCPSTLLKNKL